MDRICGTCKYAIFDYEEYYGTTAKNWFVTGCKLDRDTEDDEECESYSEYVERCEE